MVLQCTINLIFSPLYAVIVSSATLDFNPNFIESDKWDEFKSDFRESGACTVVLFKSCIAFSISAFSTKFELFYFRYCYETPRGSCVGTKSDFRFC